MAINYDALEMARKAKRMKRQFMGTGLVIPVQHNGQTIKVGAEDIVKSLSNAESECFEEFVAALTVDEVIAKAYQIVNFTRSRPSR